MVNKEIIKAKLNTMRENLVKLKAELEVTDEALKRDDRSKSALERYFQLVVDGAVGINEHIISEENLEVPDDYFGTFAILGKAGVLPEEFSEKIAPSVGLRNQIIHQYEKIDTDLMLQSIRKNIHQYDEYMALIANRYNLL